MTSFKSIVISKTLYTHLFSRLIGLLFLTGILILLIIPLILWMLFGEGSAAESISQLPIFELMTTYAPLAVGLVLAIWRMSCALKTNHESKVKSYLFVALAFLVVYPFRMDVLNMLVEVFAGT